MEGNSSQESSGGRRKGHPLAGNSWENGAIATEVAWRIRAEREGDYRLLVRAGDTVVEKELRVGSAWGPTSSLRSSGFTDLLLYPGEPPIAQSDVVKTIEIRYRRLDLSMFGWSVDWLVLFFVLSIASGFAFRKVLDVEI